MKKLCTTQYFIDRATITHAGKYDYSCVEYKAAKKNIKIICKNHGLFEQRPDHHLGGSGCPDCAIEINNLKHRSSTTNFINCAVAIHGDKYDYSMVDYKLAVKKVKIICKTHGMFEQIPASHLLGYGCTACGYVTSIDELKKISDSFIKRAKKVHSNKYDYSTVKYESAKTKVTIICKIHGVFEQVPSSHLNGCGCPNCGNESVGDLNRKSEDNFIKDAMEKHGNKYDYSIVDYKGAHTKIKIICATHGVFEQIPHNHLNDRGCPSCSTLGFNPSKPGSLYYIKFESNDTLPLYKIGVTNSENVLDRIKTMRVYKGFTHTVLKTIQFDTGFEARELEQLLHKEYAEHRYYGDPIMINGNTELFVKDVMGGG